MLDRLSYALLGFIDNNCVNNAYKIFSYGDLKGAFNEEPEDDVIKELINSLWEMEYISVKYQDENEVCLAPLVKGRAVFEKEADEKKERSFNSSECFKQSFAGGFLGGLLSFAAFVILLITGVI